MGREEAKVVFAGGVPAPFLRPLVGSFFVLSFGLVVWLPWGGLWLFGLLSALLGLNHWVGRVSWREGLESLDDVAYWGEQTIVTLSLVVMAGSVFLDVVWRNLQGLEGPWRIALGVLSVSVLGAWTRRRPNVSRLRQVAMGLGVGGLILGGAYAVFLFPHGFGWSERLALVLILWVGMLGASMAAKENRHIAVDAVRRILPPGLNRAFGGASAVVSAFVSLLLAILGSLYTRAHWLDWLLSGRRSFVFESMPIPYWVATLPIHIGFGLMAYRFVRVLYEGPPKLSLFRSVGAAALEGSGPSSSGEASSSPTHYETNK